MQQFCTLLEIAQLDKAERIAMSQYWMNSSGLGTCMLAQASPIEMHWSALPAWHQVCMIGIPGQCPMP